VEFSVFLTQSSQVGNCDSSTAQKFQHWYPFMGDVQQWLTEFARKEQTEYDSYLPYSVQACRSDNIDHLHFWGSQIGPAALIGAHGSGICEQRNVLSL
jgi:hypothetical protein